MKITGILTVYTSARDRNGNCYHAAEYTDTASGAVVRFGNIGGASMVTDVWPVLCEPIPFADRHNRLRLVRGAKVIPQQARKALHADDRAVAAVKEAIAAVTAVKA